MKDNNPLVSVIIPTRNSERTIGKCLESIINQVYKNIEIIVVDNNSTDRTKEIAKKYITQILIKGPERSAQRNFGALKSKGRYLLFIDSDMELSKNVVKDCMILSQESKTSGQELVGIIIPEISVGTNFWAKCKALERSFYVGIDWMEAARFFSKHIFNEFKGYDEKQTGTEDFDLPQRIKTKYGDTSIKRIGSYIYHNEGKLPLLYILKKKFYYAKTVKTYVNQKINSDYFKIQANPISRYKLFFSNSKKLFSNPILGFGMLFMKSSEFIFGGIGYFIGRFNDK